MKKVLFTAVFLFIASIGFSQSVKWLNSSGGSGSPQIRDLAVDQAGFIYAVGSFNANMSVHGNAVNTQGGFDVFITKFDPNGNFIWIKTISGGSNDFGYEIETDQQDNVYVSVFCQSSPLQVSDSLLSSSVSGILRFDSSGSFEAVLTTGMSVFNMKCYQGSIYARSQVNTLFKFNLDGGLIWSKPISGSITPNNVILTSPETSLEITPHGNIIFSQNCTGNYTYDGVTVNSGSGTFAIATLIDTNSNLIRNYAWGMNEGSTIRPRSAIVDANHNVYMAVNFPSSYTNTFGSSTILHLLNGSAFHALLKFDSQAAPVWAYNISCANSTNNFFDLSLDNNGNIAMLGMYTDITTLGSISFPTNSFNGNIFTATISPEGTLLTGMGLGTNNTTDRANDLELLADGAFALGGMTGTGVAPVKFGCINSVTPGFLVLKYNYETPPLPDVSFTQLREQRKVFFSSTVSNTSNVLWEFGDGATSTQRNPVHTYTTPGNFNVRLIGQNSCGADTTTSQILYKGIQKILPGKIANSRFQIVIAKGGFPFATAQMVLKKGTHTILAESTAVNDSGMVQGSFLLQNEPLGMYDVIINSGSFTDTLVNSLEMEPVRNDSLTIQVSGPSRRLINRFQPYQVTITNPSNVNYFGVPVLIAMNPNNEIARLSNRVISDSLSQLMRDSAFVHDFYMAYDSASSDSMWLGMFLIPVVAAQSTETIEFYMRGTTLGDKLLVASLLRPWYDSAQLVQLGLNRTETSCDFLGDGMNCILDILGQFPGASCLVSAGSLGCALGNLGRDAVGNRNRGGDGKKYIADVFNVMADAASTIFCSTGGIMKSKAKLVAEDAVSEWTGELLGITASFLNGEMPNNPFLKLTAIPVTIPGSCFTAFASPPKSIERFFIKDVSSMDPNDKTGPLGITTDNFIDKESTLQYLIRFENISTATAPASEVRIIDTLDNNFFDLSTLRFTGFGFADSTYQVLGGSESYVQEIDLRPAKNTIVRFTAKLDTVLHTLSWLFESLDPVTRELVADPNDGFLNPNQQSPEGEGFVSFSVRPLANRPHLQQVMNTAKIVFDENAPIFTNVWKNTVDIEKPSSQVLPLPAVLNDTTFLLRWSGTDAHAGIMGYDIYAIINDTITRRILRNTPTDSIRINGAFGNTYKFFSVASDLVGNIEDLPGVPDAVISLSAPLPLTILSFTGSRQNNDAVLQWRTVNEVSVSHFEVQRSFNGADFTKEGTVTAGGTLYSLTDPGVFNTQPVVYYRLKSVDIDGRFTYSAILKLSRNENGLLTVFPNPVKDQLVIGGLKRGAVLRIFSADGRLVQQTAVTTQTMIIDMIGYTSGIYWLQYASDGEIQTQKILKQ